MRYDNNGPIYSILNGKNPVPPCLYYYTGRVGQGGPNHWQLIGGGNGGCAQTNSNCFNLTFDPCLPEQPGCNEKYGETTTICVAGNDGSISSTTKTILYYCYNDGGDISCWECDTYADYLSFCPELVTTYTSNTCDGNC